MLKIGLVGVGGISGCHIPVWEEMPETELTALCDVRPELMKKYTGKHCYTDFDEMLEKEDLDILDICLPTSLHVECAIKALNRGIHVLCEKPISLHREDVRRVYDAAEKNHVKFMVAQCVRFWPEYMAVRDLYRTKKYGRLISGSMERLGTWPGWSWDNWFCDEKRSGLVPFDLHVHDLDFMVYTFGKPEKVHSFRQEMENQDHIHVVYEFDGFTISADTAWYAADYQFRCAFRFQFENAVAEMENGKLTVYLKNNEKFCPVSDSETGTPEEGYIPRSNAYANEIRYFTDCVLNDRAPDKVKPEELETVIDILNSL